MMSEWYFGGVAAQYGEGLHAALVGTAVAAGELDLFALGVIQFVEQLLAFHVQTLDVLLRIGLFHLLDAFLLFRLCEALLGPGIGGGFLDLLNALLLPPSHINLP